MSLEGFREWGDKRRQKSIEFRSVKAVKKAEAIRQFKIDNPSMSNGSIAKVLGYSLDTVNRALKK